MSPFFIYQIFYDQKTRAALDPGFLPLDNTANARPDWYEFWVIRNFLHANRLQENGWYGFLSPSFVNKTGLNAEQVRNFVEFADRGNSEVALISSAWDQIAYFLNPFEQGEVWHPGITDLSQSTFNCLGIDIDVRRTVCHSNNFTFSNYIVAKPAYWEKWLQLADAFFDLIENRSEAISMDLRKTTDYGSVFNQAPVKTFVQERFPLILITQNRFRTLTCNTSQSAAIFDRLFAEDLYTRGLLQTCDLLKKKYTDEQDPAYLDTYRQVRKLISVKF